MTIFRTSDSQSEALAKIAHLTGVFEKLVAEAGLRRERIEQLLAEIAEEHAEARVLSGPSSGAGAKRAA